MTAPEATETALELMMDYNLKMLYTSHVMILPWFITYIWRKLLGKEADILITLPVGISFWNLAHHEHLILACLFTVDKRRYWIGTLRNKGSKLIRRYQYILEDLLCSERMRAKYTALECTFQKIPEEVGQRGYYVEIHYPHKGTTLPVR